MHRRWIVVAKARGRRARKYVGRVAIDMGLVEGAEIRVALEAQGGRIIVAGGPVHHRELVFGRLRNGDDAVPAVLQFLDRGIGPGAKLAIARSQLQVRFKPVRLVANIAVEVGNLRISVDAPPTIVDLRRRHIDRVIANLLSVLNFLLSAIERAGANISLETLPREAVLHGYGHRAAQCVESEDWVSSNDRGLVDRILWNKLPIDRVAERLVDAHAVLIDGEADRRSADSRRVKSAIHEVRLKVVARDIADGHSRRLTRQGLRQGRVVEGLDVLRVRLPDSEGRLGDIDVTAAERRRRDHVESGKLDLFSPRADRQKGENDTGSRNTSGDLRRHSFAPFSTSLPWVMKQSRARRPGERRC